MTEENNDERSQDKSQGESQDQEQAQAGQSAAGPAGSNEFDLGVLIEEAKQVIMNPVAFYRGMAKSGGFQRPLIFVVVMAFALAILITALSFVGFGQFGAAAVGIGSLIIFPIGAVVGSFVGAAIAFVIWKLMGSEESYETAYRCVAYAGAIFPITGVIGMVPYVGSIVGIVWGMYLMVVASVEVHGRRQQSAYAVFGILGAILVLTNISGERQGRQMRVQMDGLGESLEGIEDMSPEEVGQAFGDFMRGLEQSVEEQQDEEQ